MRLRWNLLERIDLESGGGRREGDGVELVAGVQGGEVLHLLPQREAPGPPGGGHAVAQGRAQVDLLRAGREQGLLVPDVWAGRRRRRRRGRRSGSGRPEVQRAETRIRGSGSRRDLQPGAGEQLWAQARGRRRGRDGGGDAVGQRGGALVLGALADLAAVAVVGGEGQVGVEVALPQVERPVGVFQDLQEEVA